jgi:hypothetical protein
MIISNQHLSMDIDYYQYQDIHDVEEQIREVLLKKEEVRWILLYTNEQKENLKRETWFLQVLEREGMIMNSIIACK